MHPVPASGVMWFSDPYHCRDGQLWMEMPWFYRVKDLTQKSIWSIFSFSESMFFFFFFLQLFFHNCISFFFSFYFYPQKNYISMPQIKVSGSSYLGGFLEKAPSTVGWPDYFCVSLKHELYFALLISTWKVYHDMVFHSLLRSYKKFIWEKLWIHTSYKNCHDLIALLSASNQRFSHSFFPSQEKEKAKSILRGMRLAQSGFPSMDVEHFAPWTSLVQRKFAAGTRHF